jgi:LysR family transcriptional regulator, glycine cleavage system transcriptional activator
MTALEVSLNALRAFEAAARLGSMTAAAAELCVTRGAVSQRIRTLEDSSGLPLFRLAHRKLETTPEGVRVVEGLTTAFNLILVSLEQIESGARSSLCAHRL